MTDRRLLSMADFEWASVCRYVVYISQYIGLAEINSSRVNSFAMSRDGYVKTIRRKKKTLGIVRLNMKLLERFVGKNRDGLDDEEMAVIRSMYRQYAANAETVSRHIRAAEVYRKTSTKDFFEKAEDGKDEFPF
jgi:hypothetical protein